MTGAILEYARGLAVVKSFGGDIPLEHFDIAFDHVSFGYDDRQVLHDVSFTIPEKTSTAIVGPSSSGKTTLCFAVQRAEVLCCIRKSRFLPSVQSWFQSLPSGW